MDNLSELSAMVAPLLSDPQAMESLRRAAEQIGLGGLLPDGASIGDSGVKTEVPEAPPEPPQKPSGDIQAEMLSVVTKLAPLLASQKDDDAARLLSALRPFLSQPRVRRLDEAEKLLTIGRMLSIMKESKLM